MANTANNQIKALVNHFVEKGLSINKSCEKIAASLRYSASYIKLIYYGINFPGKGLTIAINYFYRKTFKLRRTKYIHVQYTSIAQKKRLQSIPMERRIIVLEREAKRLGII